MVVTSDPWSVLRVWTYTGHCTTVLKSRDSCLVHQDVGNQEHGKNVLRLACDVGTVCSHGRGMMLIPCSCVESAMLSVLELNKTLQNKPNK